MTVEIETAELRGYAVLLDRNGGHIYEILNYVKQWAGKEMEATNAEGLFAKATNFHDKAYPRAVEVLGLLNNILHGSAGELRDAAKKYDGSDQKARERLDTLSVGLLGRHGGNMVDRAGWEATASGYQDIRDPGAHTKVEPSVLEVRDGVDKILNSITDVTSMSGLVLKVIEQFSGRKPIEELVEFVSGDWESFSRCADVWHSVAETLKDVAYNIDHGNAAMDHGWSGSASEVAYAYFAKLADALMDLSGKFEQMRDVYEKYAKFVFMTTSVLADLVKQAIDLALMVLTRKKGGPFAEAFVAFYAIKIVKAVGTFAMMVISARGAVGTFFGVTAFVDEDFMGLDPALRSKPYDMAGVK